MPETPNPTKLVATGLASTTWAEAAEQIRRRVTWDLDAKAELQVQIPKVRRTSEISDSIVLRQFKGLRFRVWGSERTSLMKDPAS